MSAKIHRSNSRDSNIPEEFREILPTAAPGGPVAPGPRPDHYLLLAPAPEPHTPRAPNTTIFSPVTKVLARHGQKPSRGTELKPQDMGVLEIMEREFPSHAFPTKGGDEITAEPSTQDPWFDPSVSSPRNQEFLKNLTGKAGAHRDITLEYLARLYGKKPTAVFHSLDTELGEKKFQQLLRLRPHTQAVAKLFDGLQLQLARQGMAKFETGKNPTKLERDAIEAKLPITGAIRRFLATEPYPETFHILAKGRRAFRAPKTENTLDFPWFYRHGDAAAGLLKNPPTSRIGAVQPNEINPRVWHGMTANQRRDFMHSLRGVRVAKVYTKGTKYPVSAATAFALKLWESGDKPAFLKAVAAAPEGLEPHLPKGASKYLAGNLGKLVSEMQDSSAEWTADEAVLTAKLLYHHFQDNIGTDPENLALAVQRLVKTMIQNLPPTPQNVGTAVGVVLGALFHHVRAIKASDEAGLSLFKTVGSVLGAVGGSYGKAFSGAVSAVVALGLYKIRDHGKLVTRLRGGMEWHWTRAKPVSMQDPQTGELRSDPNFGLLAARRVDALLHLLADD